MILTRLVELYARLASEGLVERAGYEFRPIAYLLVLDSTGKLQDIIDARDATGPAKQGRTFSVPAAIKRTVGIAANLLWDNVEYVLGLPRDPDASVAELKKVAARHSDFCATIETLYCSTGPDEAVAAVRAFLAAHDPAAFAETPLAARLDDRARN